MCPSCHNPARLVNGRQLYPSVPALARNKYYCCYACDTRVGCHPGTTEPLGTMAHPALRELRRQTHSLVDALWGIDGVVRSDAYFWLDHILGLGRNEAHISQMNERQCRQIIIYIRRYNGNPVLDFILQEAAKDPLPGALDKLKQRLREMAEKQRNGFDSKIPEENSLFEEV